MLGKAALCDLSVLGLPPRGQTRPQRQQQRARHVHPRGDVGGRDREAALQQPRQADDVGKDRQGLERAGHVAETRGDGEPRPRFLRDEQDNLGQRDRRLRHVVELRQQLRPGGHGGAHPKERVVGHRDEGAADGGHERRQVLPVRRNPDQARQQDDGAVNVHDLHDAGVLAEQIGRRVRRAEIVTVKDKGGKEQQRGFQVDPGGQPVCEHGFEALAKLHTLSGVSFSVL